MNLVIVRVRSFIWCISTYWSPAWHTPLPPRHYCCTHGCHFVQLPLARNTSRISMFHQQLHWQQSVGLDSERCGVFCLRGLAILRLVSVLLSHRWRRRSYPASRRSVCCKDFREKREVHDGAGTREDRSLASPSSFHTSVHRCRRSRCKWTCQLILLLLLEDWVAMDTRLVPKIHQQY